MNPYQLGQRIVAVVERVLPFGVFVRLDNGTRAYVRRRELSLDSDVVPSTVVSVGDTLSAVVVNQAEAGKFTELSHKALLPDPWPEFTRRVREGSVVRGTVTRLLPTGAFVRLSPGVSGFIPLVEMAPWLVEKPKELLWIGDEAAAIVTRIDFEDKKIWLSIRRHMKQREAATAIAEQLFSEDETPLLELSPSIAEHDSATAITPEERERVGRILIVDDHDEVRAPMAAWLGHRGYDVTMAQSLAEALWLVKQDGCNVLLADLHLPDGDGLDLARQALECDKRPWICFMSSAEWLADRASEIEEIPRAQVFVKPLDLEEIDTFLLGIAHDSKLRPAQWAPPRKGSVAGTWWEGFDSNTTAISQSQRLQSTLQKLTGAVHAEKSVLFSMDPISHSVSIIAEAGALALQQDALYGLSDSPVKDAICEGEPVFENHVSSQAESRFRKLLSLLPFESCIGISVEAFGEVRHAVFFFHRQPKSFSPYRMRDAFAGAVLLGAILEMQGVEERVRSSGALLLSGELALAFSHEVYNKVSGLELMLRNLSAGTNGPLQQRNSLARMTELVSDMKEVAENFQRLVHAKEERRQINVNEVIQKAELLVRPLARKERVTLAFHLEADLPPVLGNSTWLQQVFLNIMLNGVQQMALKGGKHRLLEIKTAHKKNGKELIQVRFADTGSGIHKQLWAKVFELGYTTRPGGTGLGLFLVRSLLEGMGGAVEVEESHIPLGTTFLVELPILKHTEGK